MTRVLSGVQPTGNLHLGNYLGAIKNWVAIQNEHECLFCIVDLHAITVPQEPQALREATLGTAAAYIACGIDPVKSAIFHQSAVPEHAELAWLFSTITPMGWLNRMTQFKEKAGLNNLLDILQDDISATTKLSNTHTIELSNITAEINDINKCISENGLFGIIKSFAALMKTTKILKHIPVSTGNLLNFLDKHNDRVSSQLGIINQISKGSDANLGLYAYPVLMAADILLYHATHVPVGEDQKQHLELARDIAGAFNRQYKKQTQKPYFRLPEPMILGEATRVMSLRDGTKKMSKSEESDQSRINLTDSNDAIMQKIKKAKSDMEPGISYDIEKRPEVSNMLNIFAGVTGKKRDDIVAQYADSGMANFKSSLADAVIAHLEPIREELTRLKGDQAYLEGLLKQGVGRARAIANENITQIKKIMGFLQG